MFEFFMAIGTGIRVEKIAEFNTAVGTFEFIHFCDLVISRPITKKINLGEVAFRDQLRLGLQPRLLIVPGQRTLVDIS